LYQARWSCNSDYTDDLNPDGGSAELTISASAFKARCLEIFKALEGSRLARVTVTRRGRPVAQITGLALERPRLWGAHAGSAVFAPGVDPTAPALDEPLDAETELLRG
jgi:hypothetical protein